MNTPNAATIIQLVKESQFLLSLKTFSREKNSLKILEGAGFDNAPFSSFQP